MRNTLKHLQKLKKWPKMLRSKSNQKPISANIVPAGCLPIYVGKEDHRFIVEIQYLNHPLFAELLDLCAGELGYPHQGALRMACDIPLFEHVLKLLSNSNPCAHYMQITDLLHHHQVSGAYSRKHIVRIDCTKQ